MTQLEELIIMNDTMIKYLNKIEMSSKRNEIIQKILKDEACFFKMNKIEAFAILKDIGVTKEKIMITYLNLISYDNYYNLYKDGKINGNEKELIVKYNIGK